MDPHILNPELYDVNDIEVQFYQRRLKWPWRRGDVHAWGWVLFIMGILIIYGLLNFHDYRLDRQRLSITINNRKNRNGAREKLPERSFYDRASTHCRSFAYLRWKRLASISIGMCTLVLAGFLYPILYVFTQRPYYAWAPKYGPPPIAGRAGMIAVAMIPFVIALGMKVNLVSMVTGVGHEKLNVVHRWLALLMGILATVHAVPFIVEPVVNGGWGQVKAKFMSNVVYWNGVGAFICMFWLCVASLTPIRRLCYEFFVHIHILAGIGFLGLMFWHCNNMLTSWHYLIASFVIWVGCLIYRLLFKTNFLRAFHGELAHFTPLSDDGVKVTIPTTLRWEAGQHVFLRVPGISLLDNHPFTVASASINPEGEPNDLVLVFKPHKGFTRRVFDISRKDPDNSYRAYLDGPYGGLARKLESFETVLLIAGGSGITPIIGHLHQLAAKIKAKEAVTRDVRIIWTVKHFDAFEWFKDEVSKIARTMPKNILLVQYFVTQETPVPLPGPSFPLSATRDWPASPRTPSTPMTPIYSRAEPLHGVREVLDEAEYELRVLSLRKELGHDLSAESIPEPENQLPHAVTKDDSILESPRSVKSILPPLGDEVLLEFGRPPLREALRQWSEGFGKRACVYVCGPPGMKVDVANAVAEMQADIWLSDEREEVYLHTESFGW